MSIMMSIMMLLMLDMAPLIIPVHTSLWESAGGGIPFYIGVSLIARGITLPSTTCLITDITMAIPGIGEVITQGTDGATIQAMVHPTDTAKPLSRKDS